MTEVQRKERLRLGVVGGGKGSFIGEVHARGAHLSGRWAVVAGALSSRPAVALSSGREWGMADDRIYTDYAEMARAEAARPDGIHAVAITVPNHLHFPVAKAFMEAGIDVICDKPLVNTLEEADALSALQHRTGVVFGVTYSFAWHTMVRQVRQMVREGMIGAIQQIHTEYFQEFALDDAEVTWSGTPWRRDPSKVGGAATTADIGTHAHQLAEYVSGLRLERMRADFHNLGAPQPLEDSAFFLCRYTGGVPGTIMISQAVAGAQCGLRVRISGKKGTIEWSQEDPEYVHFRPFNAPAQRISRGHGAGMLSDAEQFIHFPRGHPEALSDAWANLYEVMAEQIAKRRGLPFDAAKIMAYPDLDEGIKGVNFIRKAIESHQAGGAWVEL